MKSWVEKAESLYEKQCVEWPLLADNVAALKKMRVRVLQTDGGVLYLQYNPERIRSATARIDATSLADRPCFLCETNRPAVQRALNFGTDYVLLCNPYPVFPYHYTIVARTHSPQRIIGRLEDLFLLARELPNYFVFYNGAECGASAPDHFHFQAAPLQSIPLWNEWHATPSQWVKRWPEGEVGYLYHYCRAAYWIRSHSIDFCKKNVAEILSTLGQNAETDSAEPKINIVLCYCEEGYLCFLFPRKQHRPSCYFASGDSQFLISPASVEMAGVFPLVREADFENMTVEVLFSIYKEVTLDGNRMENRPDRR